MQSYAFPGLQIDSSKLPLRELFLMVRTQTFNSPLVWSLGDPMLDQETKIIHIINLFVKFKWNRVILLLDYIPPQGVCEYPN